MKGSVERMKGKPQTVRQIFANHPSDKGLVSRICKGLSKLNKNNRNPILKKKSKELNKYFTKEDVQIAK